MYLLTAAGLTPGGSSVIHDYAEIIHRKHETKCTQNNIKILEGFGPCPVFAGFTQAFALQLRKSKEKLQSG